MRHLAVLLALSACVSEARPLPQPYFEDAGGGSDAKAPAADSGVQDAASWDGGQGTPKIRVVPAETLLFELPTPRPPAPPRAQEVEIANVGDGDLRITELVLLGPGGDPHSTSIDDFQLAPCPAWPCRPEVVLCGAATPNCMTSAWRFLIRYDNNDASELDLAELSIRSNASNGTRDIWTLQGEDEPCFPPRAIVQMETSAASIGQRFCLDGRVSAPGGQRGVSVTRFEWSLLAWPQDPAPALEVPEPGWACLTPASAGNYRVALRVTNSCGATGGPAEVSMQVGP